LTSSWSFIHQLIG